MNPPASDDQWYVGIRVEFVPDADQEAVTVIERLSHMLAGLALEGIAGSLKVTPYETVDENEAVDDEVDQ